MKNKTIKTVKQDAVSHSSNNRIKLLPVAIATVVASMSAPAWSLSFQPTDEVSVDWDTTLNYSAAWRMSDHNDDLIGNSLGDDGNRNFEKGSMVTNRFSVLSEMDIRYQNMGAFVRGSAFYDDAYFGKNDNDSPLTNNNLSVAYNEFTDETKDAHGKKARLLDAFVYGNFDVANRNLNVRVGRQVVNWGESIFIGNIGLAMSPVDGTKSNVAGVEVKDIYLPVGQVFAQLDLTENLSVAAYSQWEWAKTETNAVGSFFSVSDGIDEGGESLLPAEQFATLEQNVELMRQGIIANAPAPVASAVGANSIDAPGIRRGKDIDADDDGQWGLAFNYFAENLGNGTEFGLYYINYHEKTPANVVRSLSNYQPYSDAAVAANPFLSALNTTYESNIPAANRAQVPIGTYHIEYFENIKLIGTSFGTLIGDTNVGGEIALRKDTTVLDQNGTAMRADTVQAQLSMIHSFGVTRLADEVLFTGEIGYNQVLGKDKDEIQSTAELHGSGLAGMVTLKYNNIFPATNLEVPISFRHNIDGKSAAGTFTATGSNSDRLSIGAKFFYQDQWEAGLSYNAYFGKAEDNAYTDRDYVALNVKYSF
ncbi:DUF1302 domain-containing protein [Endozoicomonas numazuensis]|uniref:DUF1302 domain-containing protein n=1 Tax=Endozoicomonas numazuensis TaxID=1137799 RepID=A0A081NMS7_9GAMM|nr:DUF1302 domain-containing protein [Endozoicomonas numazuensis]KEQ19750.1 hypothetical protein GZ78_07740 [Endozoicomonas numazuensis]